MLQRVDPIEPFPRLSSGVTLAAEGVDLVVRSGDTERRALDNVSLTLAAGEIAVVQGPADSGKSSLVHVLGGLTAPTRGRVTVDGAPLDFTDTAAMRAFRRDRIGFVFAAYDVLAGLSPLDNVAFVAELSEARMDPSAALNIVGLSGREQVPAGELAPDEQQAVMLARAIVKWPDILLCDEPTGRLNRAQASAFLTMLTRVNRTLGITVVVATARSGVARMADHVIKLANGRVIEDHPNDRRLPG